MGVRVGFFHPPLSLSFPQTTHTTLTILGPHLLRVHDLVAPPHFKRVLEEGRVGCKVAPRDEGLPRAVVRRDDQPTQQRAHIFDLGVHPGMPRPPGQDVDPVHVLGDGEGGLEEGEEAALALVEAQRDEARAVGEGVVGAVAADGGGGGGGRGGVHAHAVQAEGGGGGGGVVVVGGRRVVVSRAFRVGFRLRAAVAPTLGAVCVGGGRRGRRLRLGGRGRQLVAQLGEASISGRADRARGDRGRRVGRGGRVGGACGRGLGRLLQGDGQAAQGVGSFGLGFDAGGVFGCGERG